MWWILAGCSVTNPVEAKPAPPRATVVQREDQPVQVAPPGTASVRELARGDNAFVADLWIEPGAKVPQHRDTTEEYLVFLEGSGTITLDGVEQSVKPGSVVYMPAQAEVSYVNGDTRAHVIQVFAGPEPAKKYEAWKAR